MAKLFDEIFSDASSGDVELLVAHEQHDMRPESSLRLWCHSLILTQHAYFAKMLNMDTPLREGRLREVRISEPCEEFVELLRYVYTSQIDVNRGNVAVLLPLADKYCIDEVVDLCLKHIKENFDADTFFDFYKFMTLSSNYQEKLKEQLKSALRQRRNLCAITGDPRWKELPIDFAEEILLQDDLPVATEAEVLTLIVQWLGTHGRTRHEVARLLGTFRKCENIWVRVSDVGLLMKALGVDIFSSKEPRTGSAVWDPSFVIHRHESAAPVPLGATASETHSGEKWEFDHGEEICHQLGPKDFLQQEPGWMHPGVHRCRITLTCNTWSHRERRFLRSGGPSMSMQAGALQKRVFDSGPSKPASHDRSPSPPPAFQLRLPPSESFETFDIAQMPDSSEQGMLSGGVIRSHLSQDKIDHELVDHQIISCVFSGYQRYGVRFSQRERNAIYLAEDLNGKQFVSIGGTISSVSFDLELMIGEASKCGISRCRFAVLRNMHVLIEEWFDVSAKVPLRFHISSLYFDKNSSYTVSVKWLRPVDQHGRIRSIGPEAQGTHQAFM
mmetsp:Transcript_19500/g.42666  ORF Transcript_19500/g.42666 Transcript_19500/m.42666 type:complete len:556 (-) Transcript_19500:154-1821(-)|eukprot:CAMPEP_0170586938 /NCGR_PEP_ID=MMETSP0224-20130122/10013_1 /TAXON_ID=285029 /ORGANISM="Togula jolla, Strain CCCM 725" /LENGTH=555 /DNA_ID=CAMNT_0010910521 /DNA_START=88 /DNA_END=1755 /DNA_ORIENTATION=+